MKSKNIIIRATLFLCFTAAWAQQVPISGETYSSSDPETCCSVTGQSAGQIELDDFSIQYTCGAYANPSKKCVPAAADSRQCASPCAADPSCKAASWTLANTKVRCYFALGDSYSIQTNKNWILLEEPSGAVTEPELEPGPGSEQEPEPTTPPEEWSEELEKCSEELDQCSDQNQKCDAGCKKCTDDHKMLEAKEKECQKKKNELQLIVTSLNAPCRSGSHKIEPRDDGCRYQVSGKTYTTLYNKLFIYHSINRFQGNGQSVEACMRSCGQNSKCIAGVWYPQERDCWLHTQILSLRIMRSAHVISFAIDKDQV